MTEHLLADRAVGALAGAAIGDALGGATEGWESHEIYEFCGGWVEGVIQSIRHQRNMLKPFSPFWKGDGHVTDDTLMTLALMQVYIETRRHLDAWDMADAFVRYIAWVPRWIPELQRETVLVERLFYPEKWIYQRLQLSGAEPRQGGIGNMVNCGAAM